MHACLFHTRLHAPLATRPALRGAKELSNARELAVMANSDNGEINRKSGIAYAAAFTLFACVISLSGVGWLADRWFGTRPWLLVAGVVLGAIVGFYQFVRLTSQL